MKSNTLKLPYNKISLFTLLALILTNVEIFAKKGKKRFCKKRVDNVHLINRDTTIKKIIDTVYLGKGSGFTVEEPNEGEVENVGYGKPTPEAIESSVRHVIMNYWYLKFGVGPQLRIIDSLYNEPENILMSEYYALSNESYEKRKEIDSLYFLKHKIQPENSYTDSVFRAWKFPKLK